MTRSQVVHARVEPGLKRAADRIFRRLGLTASDVVNALYSQVVLRKAIPFRLEIPNETTRRAIAAARRGEGKTYPSPGEMDEDLGL